MFTLIRAVAVATLLVASGPAFAQDASIGDIEIGNPWTKATPPAAKVGGGYLTLVNKGTTADRLLGGSSEIASRVEVHKMEMTDGIMKMRPVPGGLEIPAGETVELAPGGYHLMLMELKRPIADGEMIPIKLRFEQAGEVDVNFAAGPLGSTSASDHGKNNGDTPADNAGSH